MTASAAHDTTVELSLTGMHCDACVALIEETLGEQTGVQRAAVDLASERATVTYDSTAIGVDELLAVVIDAGYGAAVREPS